MSKADRILAERLAELQARIEERLLKAGRPLPARRPMWGKPDSAALAALFGRRK